MTDSSYKNSDLEKLISRCQNHAWIDLSDQQLNDKDMEIVVNQAIINKKCLNLNLRYNKITKIGGSILADAFKNNNILQILYLSYNRLEDKGVQYIANALNDNTSIIEIQLEHNEINDEGIRHLSQMLKTNQTLIHLGLADNNITDQGMEFLANALTHHNTHLQVLNIRENKLITDASAQHLADIITNTRSLEKLSVNLCNLSPTTINRLRQAAEKKHSFVLGAH